MLAEYNSNGKRAPEQPTHLAEVKIRIRDITADFRKRVLPRYEFNNAQHNRFTNLCKLLDERHGDESPEEFGPLKLESLRDHFVESGNSRKYANNQARNVVRIIKHGVSRELVSAQRIVALETLEPLRPGEARETVKPSNVDAATVNATLPHLTPVLQAMVKLQLATAMRPSELFRMTPAMIDRSGEVWMYRPDAHKTAHRGKQKAVPILADALEALQPYLFGDQNDLRGGFARVRHCFRCSGLRLCRTVA
ncbi:hypothetical protein SH139x_002402 [Planctomycetaceae bacterium SH139]